MGYILKKKNNKRRKTFFELIIFVVDLSIAYAGIYAQCLYKL